LEPGGFAASEQSGCEQGISKLSIASVARVKQGPEGKSVRPLQHFVIFHTRFRKILPELCTNSATLDYVRGLDFMTGIRFIIRLGFFFFAALLAHASAIYTYVGENFTTEQGTALYLANPRWTLSDHLSITADFASPLGAGLTDETVVPLFWSVNVGATDFTSADGTSRLQNSVFTTDVSGDITGWLFSIIGDGLFPISTSSAAGDRAGVFGPDFGGSASTTQVGTWTSTPEPGAWSVVVLALVAILFVRRGRFTIS